MSLRATSIRAARTLLPQISSLFAVPARGMAKIDAKAAAVMATSNAKVAESSERNMSPEVSLRMDFNILKDAPALEEKPDAEYPAWLWTIHNPLPTLFELQKADPETLTERQKTRLFKLVRRKDIKTANNAKAK